METLENLVWPKGRPRSLTVLMSEMSACPTIRGIVADLFPTLDFSPTLLRWQEAGRPQPESWLEPATLNALSSYLGDADYP